MTQALTNPTNTVPTGDHTRSIAHMNLRKALDGEEIDALRAELEEVDRDIAEVEDEKSEALAEFRERLKEKRDRQKGILEKLARGEVESDVEVEIEWHWKEGRKFLKRLDTGEYVDPAGEPIEEVERQMQLAGIEPEEFDDHRDDFEDAGGEPEPKKACPQVRGVRGCVLEFEHEGPHQLEPIEDEEEPIDEDEEPCPFARDGERCDLAAEHDGAHEMVEIDVPAFERAEEDEEEDDEL